MAGHREWKLNVHAREDLCCWPLGHFIKMLGDAGAVPGARVVVKVSPVVVVVVTADVMSMPSKRDAGLGWVGDVSRVAALPPGLTASAGIGTRPRSRPAPLILDSRSRQHPLSCVLPQPRTWTATRSSWSASARRCTAW